MPTLTVYPAASADDGIVISDNASWLTMRAGSTLSIDTNNSSDDIGLVDLSPTFIVNQGLFAFVTSTVGGGNSVNIATFSVYLSSVIATGTWNMDLRAHDFGASIDTTDWVAGADWSSKTLCATKNAASWTGSSYNAFTSTTDFPGAINRTGTTRLAMCTENIGATSSPGALQYQSMRMSDISGTVEDPKLYVEYSQAGTAIMLGCNF